MIIDPLLNHKILSAVEENHNTGSGRGVDISVQGYDFMQLGPHIHYLVSCGMLTGITVTHMQSPFPEYIITDITPKGRSILEILRKDEVLFRDVHLLEDRNWRSWIVASEKQRDNDLLTLERTSARDGVYQSGGRLKQEITIVFSQIDKVATKAVNLRMEIKRKTPTLAHSSAVAAFKEKIDSYIGGGVSFLEERFTQSLGSANSAARKALTGLARAEAKTIADRVGDQIDNISLELRLMPNVPEPSSVSVHVTGDGNAVNFGNVVGDVNASVQKLTQGDKNEIAAAIETLSHAIQQSSELSERVRNDYLDHLATVGEQIAKPQEKRRMATFSKAIESLSTLTTTAMKVAPLYHQLVKLLVENKIIENIVSYTKP